MSDKETIRNENPWRARGFKKPFNGTKYQEFVDANKSNALRLNLRQRELQAGKYETKSTDSHDGGKCRGSDQRSK